MPAIARQLHREADVGSERRANIDTTLDHLHREEAARVSPFRKRTTASAIRYSAG
jgi:hypothetical protein